MKVSKRIPFGWVSLPGSVLRAVPQVRDLEARLFTLPGLRVLSVTAEPDRLIVEVALC